MKKRKDGNYQKLIRFVDSKGMDRAKCIYAKTMTELAEKEFALRKQIEKGNISADMRMRDYAENWLDTISQRIAPKTFQTYQTRVNHINNAIGGMRISKIKRSDIQNMINNLAYIPKQAKMVNVTTKAIFESAIDDEIILRNPCRNIALPECTPKQKRGLTEIEKQALQLADFTDMERLFVMTLYYTGMRKGEALALAKRNIDFESRLIHVDQNVSYAMGDTYLKEPKTKNSIRDIPMPDPLYQLLRAFPCKLYLFSDNGFLLDRRQSDTLWRNIIKKMNDAVGSTKTIKKIQGLTPHIFRHNYATMMYNSGADMKMIQELLGHSSIAITMNTYTHFNALDHSVREQINKCFKVS